MADRVNLLPMWAQLLWVLVLGGPLAAEFVALASSRSRARMGVQGLTQLGMLCMFLPWSLLPARALAALFGGVLVIVMLAPVCRPASRRAPRPWREAVDLAAMSYMCVMAEVGNAAITYTLMSYYCALCMGLLFGRARHVTMAAGMAYMLLAMERPSGEIVGRVVSGNLSAQSYVMSALAALLVLAALNGRRSALPASIVPDRGPGSRASR
jgi:hypothetical protein